MAKKSTRERISGRNRAQKAAESSAGSNFFTVDSGVNIFELERKGTKLIDIVPYVTGEGNANMEPGKWYYENTVWAHRVGGSGGVKWYPCPAKNNNQKCPICEYRTKILNDREAGEDARKLADDLKAKQRQLWNVYDHDAPDKGVQVWELSYHMFGRLVDEAINSDVESSHPLDYEFFADPQDGFSLRLGVIEDSFEGKTFLKIGRVDFIKRKKALTKKLCDSATQLEGIVLKMDYAAIQAGFLEISGAPADPTGGGGSATEPEDDTPFDGGDDDGDDGWGTDDAVQNEPVDDPNPEPDGGSEPPAEEKSTSTEETASEPSGSSGDSDDDDWGDDWD